MKKKQKKKADRWFEALKKLDKEIQEAARGGDVSRWMMLLDERQILNAKMPKEGEAFVPRELRRDEAHAMIERWNRGGHEGHLASIFAPHEELKTSTKPHKPPQAQ